mgnify:CR=1 FL=1
MKKFFLIIAAALSFASANVLAQNSNNNGGDVRYIKSPRFVRPLVEKWIEEYAKTEPGVTFQIAKGASADAALNVVVDGQSDEANTVYFGKTAVLPITARGSEADRLLGGKHLNSRKLKQVFFVSDEEEDERPSKQFESLVVYSGSNATSAANAFARNLGEEASSFRGKRIAGDDLFLNTAIAKDAYGVSFNTLSNIFDLNSRRVKKELSLVGLDVKREVADDFGNEGSLDNVLAALESGRVGGIAVERVGIAYENGDVAVLKFLQWVLTQGTQFNHAYGLLNPDNAEDGARQLTAQK